MPGSGQVEAVKVHYLIPSRDKVLQELLLGVLASVYFRQSPQLGIGAEYEIDAGAGPPKFSG